MSEQEEDNQGDASFLLFDLELDYSRSEVVEEALEESEREFAASVYDELPRGQQEGGAQLHFASQEEALEAISTRNTIFIDSVFVQVINRLRESGVENPEEEVRAAGASKTTLLILAYATHINIIDACTVFSAIVLRKLKYRAFSNRAAGSVLTLLNQVGITDMMSTECILESAGMIHAHATTSFGLDTLPETIVSRRDGGFMFDEYIQTEMTTKVIRKVLGVCSILAQATPVNIQDQSIPIIKGVSGAGKTRLGAEIAKNVIRALKSDGSITGGIHLLRRMDHLPRLNSAHFVHPGTMIVDADRLLLEHLVRLTWSNEMGWANYPRIRLDFTLDQFLQWIHQTHGVKIIMLQLDEYRQDMLGVSAMVKACCDRLGSAPTVPESSAFIYPIITGMTSYVETIDDTLGSATNMSGYPGTDVYHVAPLDGEARRLLEDEFINKLVVDSNARVDTTLAYKNKAIRFLLDAAGGHPRFYQFLARDLDGSKVAFGTLTMADANRTLRQISHRLKEFYSISNWRSLVNKHMTYHQAQSTDVDTATTQSIKQLMALALTRISIDGIHRWTFADIEDQSLDMTLETATNSGIFTITMTDENLQTGFVLISPMAQFALNQVREVVSDVAIGFETDYTRDTGISMIASESIRIRIAAMSCVGKTNSVPTTNARDIAIRANRRVPFPRVFAGYDTSQWKITRVGQENEVSPTTFEWDIGRGEFGSWSVQQLPVAFLDRTDDVPWAAVQVYHGVDRNTTDPTKLVVIVSFVLRMQPAAALDEALAGIDMFVDTPGFQSVASMDVSILLDLVLVIDDVLDSSRPRPPMPGIPIRGAFDHLSPEAQDAIKTDLALEEKRIDMKLDAQFILEECVKERARRKLEHAYLTGIFCGIASPTIPAHALYRFQ